MEKRFSIRQLFRLLCVGGIIGVSGNAFAAGFQLYEQDGASVGDYHAGRAAQANDASTTFYNPAGLVRMKNQQIVLGDVGVFSDLKYRGTDSVFINAVGFPTPIPYPGAQNLNVVAQGGAFSQLPDFYYALPITSNVGLGISLNVPFGLRTDYGRDTALRYAATKSDIEVVDLSPAFGVMVYKGLSLGAGFDMQRMAAEFDLMAYGGGIAPDSYSTNKGWSTAYGFHVGALYQFLQNSRVGLTYNSQIVHHIRGTSRFTGPLANFALDIPLGNPATIYSGEANAHLTLPAYTTLSGFHQVNSKWAVMGSVIYTQWSVIQNLTLQDIAAAEVVFNPFFGPMPAPSSTLTVNLPTHYRNTWNLSLGTEFYATDKITLRGGVGYDQTPVQNFYRDVRIPDKDRYAIALGTHFQATKTLGVDLGWTHLFMAGLARINPPPQVTGGQLVQTNGNLQGSADVFGAQLTWDIV
ncbi:MAG: outer membrane protein transport protein [Pseudomonadota bacterium]